MFVCCVHVCLRPCAHECVCLCVVFMCVCVRARMSMYVCVLMSILYIVCLRVGEFTVHSMFVCW